MGIIILEEIMEIRKNNFVLFRSIIDAYLNGEITRKKFIHEWNYAQKLFEVKE